MTSDAALLDAAAKISQMTLAQARSACEFPSDMRHKFNINSKH
jgi:hypothetical protein